MAFNFITTDLSTRKEFPASSGFVVAMLDAHEDGNEGFLLVAFAVWGRACAAALWGEDGEDGWGEWVELS